MDGSTASIEAWLRARVAKVRGADARAIDPRERFHRYGVDSFVATSLLAELSGLLNRALAPTLLWQYPTIDELSRFLGGELPFRSAREVRPVSRSMGHGPIAVIGLACRFPRASGPNDLWNLLVQGVDAISDVPKQRWDIDSLYDRDPSAPGKVSTREGGFLGAIDGFDALFFGISPREAVQMDPQQRLMLELSWEALEDAGIPPRSLQNTRTGVFFGAMWTDYARLSAGLLNTMTQHTATGQDTSIIPARVSYTFGFRGPSMAINTACSSSLVAIHSARQSLLLGESTLALAGGVNLLIAPDSAVAMSKFGAMAPDNRCKAFDARADGYVRGEGAGVIVLKPLRDALADGDPIRCILLGSAVNNDGASNGLTAPNPDAQRAVIEEACAAAGVLPHEVHYVEAHGTGTMLGDPIEATALGLAYGDGRAADAPLRVGSIKTNIGHLEAAAGIAGLIKATLALEHRIIPPNLHFEKPNPYIPFDTLKISIPTQPEPWPSDARRAIAGVSSFGFGGTNCHVLLERASPTDAEQLETLQRAHGKTQPTQEQPVFVFAGQGSQWLHMGEELFGEPAFRTMFARCNEIISPYLSTSLLDLLRSNDPQWLEETALVQPAIFAVQVSLAALFKAWGITPGVVIGQSMGELAAATVAGCLDLEDAARIVCARSRLVMRVAGRGAMAMIELSAEQTEQALVGREHLLSIAVTSSPTSTVIAGDPGALSDAVAMFEQRGVQCRKIKVDYASHCVQMEPILPDLLAAITNIRPHAGNVPFFSTVTGSLLDGRSLDAAYWCKNLRAPVRFAEAMQRLLEDGREVFLDMGPHPLLVRPMQQCLDQLGRAGLVLSTLQRDEPARDALFDMMRALFARGSFVSPPSQPSPMAKPTLIPLSAHSPQALADAAAALSQWLQKDTRAALPNLSHTLGARRSHHEHRLAWVGSSREELTASLQKFVAGDASRVQVGQVPIDRPQVVFVFPGQGSQWLGMGRTLLRDEPSFRAAILACDEVIQREAGFSVEAELGADASSSRFSRIEIMQPTLFAMEVALAALFRAWNIEPAAVLGHSMGEVAAAYVAGVLSLDDAAAIICRRSRLLSTVSGRGAMALVEMTRDQAREVIAGQEDTLAIAAENGPRSTVLAGDGAAIDRLLSKLEQASIFCRRINVDVASHSPEVDPLLAQLREQIAAIAPKHATVPFYSTVTGARCVGPELSADYWVNNLREPVLFGPTIATLAQLGPVFFVEISPHPILVPAIAETLHARGADGAVAIASLRRGEDERRCLLEAVAALYIHGCHVDVRRLDPLGTFVPGLPTYPWQRRRYWIDIPDQARGMVLAPPAMVELDEPAALPAISWRDRVLAAGDNGNVLIAESVAGHIRRVLRLESEAIAAGVTLRALGLDSLLAMELRNRIHRDFQVDIAASRFFAVRGAEELAALVQQHMVAAAPTLGPTQIIEEMETDAI